MRSAASFLALLAALALACAPPADGEHGEPATTSAEPAHEHEARHDEFPRSVAVADAVIADAGVVSVPVERRALAPTVRLPGEVVANPDHEASVAARVDGIIESVKVQPGDAVSRGDVLATVRAPDLQSLRAAAAALKAKAMAARANADRLRSLVDKRMASEQEAIAADADADALEAEARAARERLRALGVGRGSVTFDVRASMDGVVLERAVVVGAPVGPETVIATLVASDEVWFVAHVYERDISRVEAGAAASVRLNAYPDAEFHGRVEYVSQRADPGARTLSARIPLANPDGRLRLGLFGTAHVVANGERSAPVLVVPNLAITRVQDRPVTFVRHPDGHFELHEVVLGEHDDQYTEIVHGLREGEQVVSEGVFTIKSALLRETFGEGPE